MVPFRVCVSINNITRHEVKYIYILPRGVVVSAPDYETRGLWLDSRLFDKDYDYLSKTAVHHEQFLSEWNTNCSVLFDAAIDQANPPSAPSSPQPPHLYPSHSFFTPYMKIWLLILMTYFTTMNDINAAIPISRADTFLRDDPVPCIETIQVGCDLNNESPETFDPTIVTQKYYVDKEKHISSPLREAENSLINIKALPPLTSSLPIIINGITLSPHTIVFMSYVIFIVYSSAALNYSCDEDVLLTAPASCFKTAKVPSVVESTISNTEDKISSSFTSTQISFDIKEYFSPRELGSSNNEEGNTKSLFTDASSSYENQLDTSITKEKLLSSSNDARAIYKTKDYSSLEDSYFPKTKEKTSISSSNSEEKLSYTSLTEDGILSTHNNARAIYKTKEDSSFEESNSPRTEDKTSISLSSSEEKQSYTSLTKDGILSTHNNARAIYKTKEDSSFEELYSPRTEERTLISFNISKTNSEDSSSIKPTYSKNEEKISFLTTTGSTINIYYLINATSSNK
ncbi:unnamed protein product, partial [Timema podura]|nr:unnamed protein product [Timema podura]